MSFSAPAALLLLLALPFVAWLVWPRRAGGRPLSGWVGLGLRLLIVTLIAVSYTHLDVYKRQPD